MTTPTTGPRLSDLDFFTRSLDPCYPGLERVADLARAGEFAEARRIFATVARQSLQPERFFTTVAPKRRENKTMHDGESLAQAAERILRLELISCGVPMQFQHDIDWSANPTHNQYCEWPWQLNRHWEWDLLAEQYRLTGDERFAEGFVRFFRSWVRQAIVPLEGRGSVTACWRTIEAGIRMGRPWPRALHTFYRSPHFNDDVLVDFYKSLYEHGWRLRNFHWTHNWLIMEMNGLCHIAVLCPMFAESNAWREYAITKLTHELDTQVYDDGMQFELSTGYHQVNIINYMLTWRLLDAYEVAVPDRFRTILERMHEANLRLMMPDGRLPDLNDGSRSEVATLLSETEKYHPHRDDFRWARTRGAEGTPPKETSHAFANCGYFVLRTGWRSDATWAFFDGGDYGFAHQHEDKLNVLLHAHGRSLISEGGNYAYDSSEMRRYVLSTRGHNTIRVDGFDQNRGKAFHAWRSGPPSEDEILRMLNRRTEARWDFSDARDLVSADYAEGYGPDAVRSVSHRRTLALLKRPPAPLGPCCLVIDELSPADASAHRYEALWHFNTHSAAIATGNALAAISEDVGEANVAVIVADDAEVSVRVVTGQTEPEWQGWLATSAIQGQCRAAPTAVATWTRSGPHRVITLLYPFPANTPCPVRRMACDEQSIRIELEDGHSVVLPLSEFMPATVS